MLKQLNSKVLVKSLQTALVMTFFGIIVQMIKGQLILKLPPPEARFIGGVFISYILVGIFYAIGFYIFRNALPGKTPEKKGLVYALLCSLTVLIPGIFGMIAFDFEGGFNLITPYKVEQYFILIIDFMNFMIGGLVMAKLFKGDIVVTRSASTPKKRILKISLLGTVLFPSFMWAVHVLAEGIFSLGLEIPAYAKQWYYIALNVPFVLTGGFLPLFYQMVKPALPGSWVRKSFSFFLVFYICYWLLNVGFMINFGFSLHYVVFLLAISIPALLLSIMINGFFIEKLERMFNQVPFIKQSIL